MYKDVLVAIDLGHDGSWKKALPTAVEYAKAFGATLHLCTVVPDFGMSIVGQYFPQDFEDRALADAEKRLHAFIDEHVPDDVRTQVVVGHGGIYQELLRAAAETKCDLIIMASHRPELADFLIGPNAIKVVSHADCSVLVVRD